MVELCVAEPVSVVCVVGVLPPLLPVPVADPVTACADDVVRPELVLLRSLLLTVETVAELVDLTDELLGLVDVVAVVAPVPLATRDDETEAAMEEVVDNVVEVAADVEEAPELLVERLDVVADELVVMVIGTIVALVSAED